MPRDRTVTSQNKKRVSPMTKAQQLGAAQAQSHFYNKPKKATLPVPPWESASDSKSSPKSGS